MTIQNHLPASVNPPIAVNHQNAGQAIEGSAAEEKTETAVQERAETQKPGEVARQSAAAAQIQDPMLGQTVNVQA
ncbi:hypothetical protein AGMMS4952_20160 [Spirochaetia bacterium]|nr:hypothetical protein AGMMS4952_20160 [Spirochaetia bacterium]